MARKKNPNLEAARARMYHDLVFERAERLFAERGFDETPIQDVAADAGISLKTLYAAFPAKNDIYAEILAVRGAAFVEATTSGAAVEGTGLERMRASLAAIVDFLVEHDSFRRILLQEGRAWGLDPRTPSERGAWLAGIEQAAQLVRQGIGEGIFHDEDPELLAVTMLSVIQVQLSMLLERAGEEPDPESIADQIFVSLRRMLCRDPEADTARRVA